MNGEYKENLKTEGSFNYSGKNGYGIHINDYVDDVCIKNHHMPINNQSKIDEIIQDYDNAKIKAEKIQKMLSQL